MRLSNSASKSFWDALWLGIRPSLCFRVEYLIDWQSNTLKVCTANAAFVVMVVVIVGIVVIVVIWSASGVERGSVLRS